MNIICVICTDLLSPSDDVFYTPCGHIFHFVCLTQWFERSKSCPQCREKTSIHKIHRIYFNFSNNDSIKEDASSLQNKIDKLTYKIVVHEKDIKQHLEKIGVLEKQNSGLRKEVKKVESEINEKKGMIYALKEQTKYLKEQNSEVESLRKEVGALQKKVEEYRNVQILLNAPGEDVDDMMSRTRDPSTLTTYISVLKREMTVSLDKRREQRAKLRSLQQELTKVSMERDFLLDERTKREKLEEDYLLCESENMTLQNKLRNLECTIEDLKKAASFNAKTIELSNSDNVKKSSRNDEVNAVSDVKVVSDFEERNVQNCIANVPELKKEEENSPYLPVKSQGVFSSNPSALQRHTSMKLGSSILAKKPRIIEKNMNKNRAETSMTYDGFGGHAKYDRFPSPISTFRGKKIREDATRTKRQRLDTGDNFKLGNFNVNVNVKF